MAWAEPPAPEPASQPEQPKKEVEKGTEEEEKESPVNTEEKREDKSLAQLSPPEELEPPQPVSPRKIRSAFDLEHRTVSLSGGQMQRVAISRVCVASTITIYSRVL